MLVGALVILLAGTAAAQTGYYAIEELGIFAEGDLEVDIDLQSAMLQVAAGALENENADLARMVAELDRVRVQVGSPKAADASAIERAFATAMADLEGLGWNKILSVQEDDEKVYLFGIESGGAINGLTVLVNSDGEDVVLANLVGTIDPVVLGRLLASLDEMPDFEGLLKGGE